MTNRLWCRASLMAPSSRQYGRKVFSSLVRKKKSGMRETRAPMQAVADVPKMMQHKFENNHDEDSDQGHHKRASSSVRSTAERDVPFSSLDVHEEIPPKVAITTYSAKATSHTNLLASHLSIPFISPEASPIPSNFLLVISERERMMLRNVGLGRDYYVDFYQIHHQFCAGVGLRQGEQQQYSTDHHSSLDMTSRHPDQLVSSNHLRKPRYKVLRHIFPESHPKYNDIMAGNLQDVHMLDLTGGMGVNAYIYAHAGLNVTLVEKDPVLYALLYEGYELAKSLPGLRDVMKRIHLVHADPLEYMQMHLKEHEQKEEVENRDAERVWDDLVNEGKKRVSDVKESSASQDAEDKSVEPSLHGTDAAESTTLTTVTKKKLKKKRKKLIKRTMSLSRRSKSQPSESFPWDFVLMEPRYYDGMHAQQGYYQKNLEEVLKANLEHDMDWEAYAYRIQEVYETALNAGSVPVLIKYPVMTTKFLDDDKWVVQRHEAQYIDRVYKRFADQDYEYQVYVPPSDARFSLSKEENALLRQKNYLSLKFKEHQRKAQKLGGKDALREHERQQERQRRTKRHEMIEVIDDRTPFARDELSALDIEGLKKRTQERRRERQGKQKQRESV
eukprot:CAMPEP_0117439530 /NCGR_PEP_ID=MMETSP0759-20121206/2612_1 /TAXON_ID=63605 /ORGANISM="Percolomonas cosmopolitus, Strain WS" /LENGTH=613 /DNA_ID=CAMNT_0005231247 /DNA_START=71 /DNA_END=1913 /DNA_ORIENTATION=+